MAPVDGETKAGWEGVRTAFEANFTDHDEVGASLAVYHRGEKVVDLWGGQVTRGGADYTSDTLQLVFSSTKGAAAACVALLVDRGELDPGRPVADYWPEFGVEGKETIPVEMLLTHQSGLFDVDSPVTLEQALAWDPAVEALAEQKPHWEPGTQHGYHAVTYGFLVGEVVRRITGRSLGAFFRDEIATPLGLDFWIGLPPEHHERVAPVIPFAIPDIPEVAAMVEQFVGAESTLGRALAGPGGAMASALDDTVESFLFNRPEVWVAEIPSANGITNGRSLARMYAALIGEVDGFRLISPETLADVARTRTQGVDQVLMYMDIQFGLGFMKPSSLLRLGGPNSIGHYGAGGSLGMADPDADLALGYAMNRMELGLAGDPRSADVIDAAYAAIAG